MNEAGAEFGGALLEFVASELAGDRQDVALGPDSDLLGSGLLDSLAVMRLVGFIERRREVTIPPADITIENFMTVRSIIGYLESLESDGGRRSDP